MTPFKWMHNPAGKSPKPFIWFEIRTGEICHNIQLYQRSTFESSNGKSHESKVTLRASGKGCSGVPLGGCIRSAWFNCWCQFFRCLAVILFFISQPGAVELGLRFSFFFFIVIVIMSRGRVGCFAHNAMPAVCYFCCFMMWPSCYVTRDMKAFF